MNANQQTRIIAILVAVLLICLVSWAIYKQVQEHHLQDDPKLRELMEHVKPLFENDNYNSGLLTSLNERNILDEITLYKGNKSYTINKEKVFLCLKDENGEYYNKNMLTYVLLHELSHVICDEIGHTNKFHQIFDEVLAKAAKRGIYDPSFPIDTEYCKYND